LTKNYDFLVAGGSVAGLSFAAEAAKNGATVVVAEEHPDIGEPEKCDGLVSLRGFRKYGNIPEAGVIQNDIASALIHSPSDRCFSVNATSLDVVVIDRSEYDKQLAKAARAAGAEVRTSVRVGSPIQVEGSVQAEVGDESLAAKYFVDATGPASSPRRGIVPAAKYELEGDWVRERVVEVFMDAQKYPGFFAWVIPYGGHKAKVGAAGHGINPFRALEDFLLSRPSKILRKVSAPIYVGGPVPRFVEGRKIHIGESAGQVKPTTAGGIMTSMAGATMAARWACKSLAKNDPKLLANYQRDWEAAFIKEMKAMLRLRGVLEKLSNDDLDAVISTFATPRLILKLSGSDFDFHATALLGALGVSGVLKVAKVVASAEVRSLLLQN
jgi:digeranylgeranylglycerophospholipid reductase